MFRILGFAFALAGCLVPLSVVGQDAKPVAGSLMMAGKTYKLAHVVAYETKVSDEPETAVIASDRPISVETIKKSLKENDGSDDGLFLTQPHVRVLFDKAGEPTSVSAWAANFSTSTSGSGLTGALKVDGGRATGKAKLEKSGEGDFVRSFEFEFSVGMLGTSAEQAPQAAPLAKLGVSGKFVGNGKEAKLAFVSAVNDEEFGGKPGLVLIFSEKDHTKDKNPKFNVSFGRFGSALIVSCHEDGSIYGCQVSHAAHEKRGFSSIGDLESGEFQVAGGQVQGKFTTNGQQEVFGETWEAELTFAAPYKSQAKAPTTGRGDEPPKVASRPKPADEPKETKPKPEPTKTAGPTLKVKDLALPAGAKDIEYKALVEHLSFKSASDVKALVGELSKSLEGQGWKSAGGDLVTAKSSILHRERGEAELTIFVKPDGAGSTVTMFTEGLEWEE
jgi:hypothetical protein